jgi:hypothetical protein
MGAQPEPSRENCLAVSTLRGPTVTEVVGSTSDRGR